MRTKPVRGSVKSEPLYQWGEFSLYTQKRLKMQQELKGSFPVTNFYVRGKV
jgi:hypothetical protein